MLEKLKMRKNHQFANSIKEEIIEKIEFLYDVKKVLITFSG